MSLYRWGIGGSEGFVGLENFIHLFTSREFYSSLLNTFYYSILNIPLSLTFGFFFAILLNEKIKGRGIFRTIYFLPMVTSIIAISIVWKWLYNPERGVLNYLLSLVGLKPLKWLEDPRSIFEVFFGLKIKGPSLALFSLVFMNVWKSTGYNVIIILAGLQNIPSEYYEAAKIDGANWWQRFWHITFPLISPTTFYLLIISVIFSFNMFAPVWMMTGPPPGSPLGTTKVALYYFYEQSFELWKLGYGAAVSIVLFLIILIITMIQRKVIEKRVHYEI